jgi:protein required for attachment to host cells
MENGLGIKLIAVINSVKMVLYESKGLKITKNLGEMAIVSEKHHHHQQEKGESSYQKKSAEGSLFEPHSAPNDLEHHEAAKKVAEILEEKVNNNSDYTKLVIIATPKMLGCVKQSISNHLKKLVYKEIAKNLVGQDIRAIEKNVSMAASI